jgi:dGTPase
MSEVYLRKEIEELEGRILAPFAMKCKDSRGRVHPEEEHPYRTCFQRDRDRIIHSTAFRRLEYKTQVFVNHEGDHFRTRLTHTIEVTQIARSIARALCLNEDLAEAVALAHDLGHTPFGHAGEVALHEIMKENGGFEHNRQSLRVVDYLEEKYPEFPGLNLTYEVREGIIKHETDWDKPFPEGFNPEEKPVLEAQIVNLADEIAYNCHDIDDGLYSKVLSEQMLEEVEIWKILYKQLKERYINLSGSKVRHFMVRQMINWEVSDLLQSTGQKIKELGINSVEDVRQAKEPIICLSPEMRDLNAQLKSFLFQQMYKHFRMVRMADKARRILTDLFEAYLENPEQLPGSTREKLKTQDKMRVVCDYIAGMTDRFAQQEYKKLFDPFEKV